MNFKNLEKVVIIILAFAPVARIPKLHRNNYDKATIKQRL